jgi:hypothetical protein
MRKNKNSDENFTSLLSAIDRQAVAPDQEFMKQLRERSAREFAAGAPDVSTNTPKSIHIAALRSIIMKSPITKLATAAIVAIACLIGLSLWRGTESGIALADVLARIEKVNAFRYQWNVKITGEDPNKPYSSEERNTTLESQEYGKKSKIESLDPKGGESTFSEHYTFPDKKTAIRIWPKQKNYGRIEWDDVTAERLWQMNDPRTYLKKILECKYESLGRATIDGIEVEGFQTTDPYFFLIGGGIQIDAKVWVDVKTRLPVRYDFTWPNFDQMGTKIIERGHIVMHDFQWDVAVDAAEFEPVIPDDYTGTVIKFPAHITEETVIQGLKLLVELLGKYPDLEIIADYTNVAPTVLLSALEKSETPAAMRLKEELKGLTDDEIGNKLVDFLMPIRGLARFCDMLAQDGKHPQYYGKTVTPKDADKVLMRWKVSDSEYRVIYGDLHAETVTAEKLAELEATLPK